MKHKLRVSRTLRHVYAEIINDSCDVLASSSTLALKYTQANSENCSTLGADIAKKAIKLNIKKCSFDRNGNLYHGRIKAVAEGARKEGLEF
jgi:large subunit ribosomal protein L18